MASSCVNQEREQECYLCTYGQVPDEICTENYVLSICITGQHQQSFQEILEVERRCGGSLMNSNEEIRFIEDLLAELENEGAVCEKL